MHTLALKIVSAHFGLIKVREIILSHVCQGLRLHAGTCADTAASCRAIRRSVALLLIFLETVDAFKSSARSLCRWLETHDPIGHVSAAIMQQSVRSNIILNLARL